MKAKYHREITQHALGQFLQTDVLETVIVANLGQDALRYQFGHDHFHYDSSFFGEGDAYCDEQRRIVVAEMKIAQTHLARQAFGRLAHTVQDFYAHSNYVSLWREFYPDVSPWEIDPEQDDILRSSRLHSGKLYYPFELLSFVEGLREYVLPFLPRDSHAWMNKDIPSRLYFDVAFAAAVKRTNLEFQRICGRLSSSEVVLFTGKES
ncbi:MAG: hypothetical protein WCK35_30155 [Chloroflexota bacterium]